MVTFLLVIVVLLQNLGCCIRKIRNQNNLSQEELAARAGLHRTYIGSLERGERNPTLMTVQKIANALNLSLVELLIICDEESR